MRHRNTISPPAALIPLLAIVILVSGCGLTTPRQDPSRFFVLSPVVEAAADADFSGPAIAVGRIDLPAYTDRPQIVTRAGSNELIFSEFNRWAEPLAVSFGRAVGQNLGALLNSDRVTTHPWGRAFSRDYEVYITVLAFDAYPEQGVVSLHARWRVTTEREAEVIGESVVNIRESAGAAGSPALVAAWDQAIGALCREIAAAIGNGDVDTSQSAK